ncbi:lamin tail domain-containing protein [Flavobacterium lindanitolerans]|uniref:Secreted protein (Por secretion system target) n=1 Tax=Flavobacterium lindanitolerans TaxID=428988 RepID=A0A497V9F7_9FLAO|nr:lamin tail domain-containing protein [Flavobacterium lindanitolerans]PKW28609.1 putative secreted protein (Por secretion system target) [Flavobacterium lindanitolerans]RLJ35886.1 putative secreted protein (Por secretion system target) [Flavobacterium lindanitolerans]
MKKLYILLSVAFVSVSASAQVVISQVYGGGGNNGAVYTNDFIELYNRGTAPQSLNGWSVQYASAAGTSWAVQTLPNVTIQPGKYYLIQQAAGTTPVAALPTPDLDGVTCGCTVSGGASPAPIPGFSMAGTNGKVILVNTTVAETTANPTGSQIIDKVGYGTANGFEGSAATAALTNSTAAIRNNNGCADTNDNAADFTVAAPTPRNSATAANTCSLGIKDNEIAGLKVYPNPVTNGKLFITSNANVEKTVAIYDVLGKQVVNTTATESVNVSNLKGGVYIVKITEEGKTATRKLVIK